MKQADAGQIESGGGEPEVVTGDALAILNRSEIDVQIATAHRFPRSMELFKKRAISMATLDEETAASCIYRRPVGKENGVMKYAEGLSVRMAEIVGAAYGNLRVGSMLIENTPRQVKARGFAHDLESNFASTSEQMESTVTSSGGVYSERMRIVVAKAALAKARRDATFQVVPKALCKAIEAAAREVVLGKGVSLEKRREAVVGWINKLGISPGRVYAALGIKGPSDMTTEHLEILTGLKTAIKDGEVQIDEAFPAEVISTQSPADRAASIAAGAKTAVSTAAPADTKTPKSVDVPAKEGK